MNRYQELWWHQAESDHAVFELLRSQGMAQCHSLHYLQMVTEKIAKAYFWRSGSPPPKNHSGFAQFLRFLGQIRKEDDRVRIANLFSFQRFTDFQNWLKAAMSIAYELECLAPAIAKDSENPEYPWPHKRPEFAPANYHFKIWDSLASSRGRNLMRILGIAVTRFPEYADT